MKTAVKAIFGGIGTLILFSGVFLTFFSLFVNPSVDLTDSVTGLIVLYILHSLRFLSFMLIGFVSARIAQKGELVYGLVHGAFIYLFFSSIKVYIRAKYGLSDSGMIPLYYLTAFYSTPLSIVACMTGAYIQKRMRNKKERKESLENKIEDLGKTLSVRRLRAVGRF
ncbi:MAG TPA: hypothetical protein VNW06_12240, partial [Cytophagaceae bacterium]|jgi:hypothetical protein|nr:hypothetical protein [Cytophagaceae bacterium]